MTRGICSSGEGCGNQLREGRSLTTQGCDDAGGAVLVAYRRHTTSTSASEHSRNATLSILSFM